MDTEPEIKSVWLWLPWPPSVNKYWRPGRGKRGRGRMYKSATAKEFSVAVQLEFIQRYGMHPGGLFPLERLQVRLKLYPPKLKRKRDIDNTLKAILDGLRDAGVYADDEQVDELEVKRSLCGVTKAGGVEVLVREVQ